jgi:hypothetical protein
MKRKLWGFALAVALAAGCGHWHVMRPMTANNIKVGELTVYVVSAEYAQSGGRLKMVLLVDNPTGQPEQFDPSWLYVRGASGISYQRMSVNPSPSAFSAPPHGRTQVIFMFRGIPPQDLSPATLMVAGTATMQFQGYD